MRHTRAVHVDEIGWVTVRGRPREELRAEPAAGEPPIDVSGEVGGMLPKSSYEHPAVARLIAERTVDPELTSDQVGELPAMDRYNLLTGILEAHPETRRLLNAERA